MKNLLPNVLSSYLLCWCEKNQVCPFKMYSQFAKISKLVSNVKNVNQLAFGLKELSKSEPKKIESIKQTIDSDKDLYQPIRFILKEILSKKDAVKNVQAIFASFEKKIKVKSVKLTIASEITNSDRDYLDKEINKLNPNGVDFIVQKNPDLLGGWVLLVDFLKIDNSALGRLENILSIAKV